MSQVHNQGIEIHQKICCGQHFKVLEATWFQDNIFWSSRYPRFYRSENDVYNL